LNTPARGDIWVVRFSDEPMDGEVGFEWHAIVLQVDPLNLSRLSSTIVVPLTAQMKYARGPGNVIIPADARTGLRTRSVAKPIHVASVSKDRLRDHIGSVHPVHLSALETGLKLVMGLP
jgi:mRNA interferase MazF